MTALLLAVLVGGTGVGLAPAWPAPSRERNARPVAVELLPRSREQDRDGSGRFPVALSRARSALATAGDDDGQDLPGAGEHLDPLVERMRYTMGTIAAVRIDALREGRSAVSRERLAALAEGALDRIDEIDRAASLYKADSDLCRVNATAFPRAVAAGPILMDLLGVSQRLARATRGAFDPTVKPLMDQLGFYRELGSTADPRGLDGALARVGWRALVLDPAEGTVRFRKPGMSLDLGGVAKGYALDRAAKFLRSQGIERASIELGRSFYLLGRDPSAPSGAFVLDLAVPGPDGDEVPRGTIRVGEGSVATSSPLSQRRTLEGGRSVGHVVDPKRGPLTSPVLSATVWASSGAEADALATALVVAGPRGLARFSRALRFEAILFLNAAEVAGRDGAASHRDGAGQGPPAAEGYRILATPGLSWEALPPDPDGLRPFGGGEKPGNGG